MQIYVARLNIENFRKQIATETNVKTLDVLRRLLAQEEAKLTRLLAMTVTPMRVARPPRSAKDHENEQP
jgi:hypothetical protein